MLGLGFGLWGQAASGHAEAGGELDIAGQWVVGKDGGLLIQVTPAAVGQGHGDLDLAVMLLLPMRGARGPAGLPVPAVVAWRRWLLELALLLLLRLEQDIVAAGPSRENVLQYSRGQVWNAVFTANDQLLSRAQKGLLG